MILNFDGSERGCGYPQVGGTYLVAAPSSVSCDRMPFEIPVCPTCGETVRFSRSMQKINALKLFGEHEKCKDPKALRPCPACQPDEQAGLMWVGDSFYSPSEFLKEAAQMGVSKRIHIVPKFFEIGHTWLFFAHKKALKQWVKAAKDGDEIVPVPGIIAACMPSALLRVMKERDITDEKVKTLEEKGIDILAVPDDERFTTPFKSKAKEHPLDVLVGGNG